MLVCCCMISSYAFPSLLPGLRIIYFFCGYRIDALVDSALHLTASNLNVQCAWRSLGDLLNALLTFPEADKLSQSTRSRRIFLVTRSYGFGMCCEILCSGINVNFRCHIIELWGWKVRQGSSVFMYPWRPKVLINFLWWQKVFVSLN